MLIMTPKLQLWAIACSSAFHGLNQSEQLSSFIENHSDHLSKP